MFPTGDNIQHNFKLRKKIFAAENFFCYHGKKFGSDNVVARPTLKIQKHYALRIPHYALHFGGD